MTIKWAPVRKIWTAAVAFLATGTGVTLINDLVHAIPVPWIAALVGGIPVLVGYLVPGGEAKSVPPTQ